MPIRRAAILSSGPVGKSSQRATYDVRLTNHQNQPIRNAVVNQSKRHWSPRPSPTWSIHVIPPGRPGFTSMVLKSHSGKTNGNFSNWGNYALGTRQRTASGTRDRPWRGEMHLVAIYDKVLTPAEVGQNFLAGID